MLLTWPLLLLLLPLVKVSGVFVQSNLHWCKHSEMAQEHWELESLHVEDDSPLLTDRASLTRLTKIGATPAHRVRDISVRPNSRQWS